MKYSIKQNKLTVFVLLSVCALILSGCNPDFYVSQTPVIAQFQTKSPDTIDREADEALSNGSYNKAISYFRAIIGLYPDYSKMELVQLKLISSYAARGQIPQALRAINEFLQTYPKSSHISALQKKQAELEHKQVVNKSYQQSSIAEIQKRNKLILDKVFDRLERKRDNV